MSAWQTPGGTKRATWCLVTGSPYLWKKRAMSTCKIVLVAVLSCISGSAIAQQTAGSAAPAAASAAPTPNAQVAASNEPAPASAVSASTPATTANVPISERPARNSVTSMPADYAISSQDTLTIDVFGVPELNQAAIQVDNAGTVAMPLIGRVQAAGLTTSQLSQRIASELDQKYVKNPVVTVTVKDPASQ